MVILEETSFRMDDLDETCIKAADYRIKKGQRESLYDQKVTVAKALVVTIRIILAMIPLYVKYVE